MKRKSFARTIGILAIAAATLLAAYLFVIRRWHVNWGATAAEVARAMPGDEVVQSPGLASTRAITIAARPVHIWPWLVQMGYRRGGWYSIDLIDNEGKPSANRIVPELQDLKVGDKMLVNPAVALTVTVLEPNRAMLWVGPENAITMSWGLYPIDESHTRLVLRDREVYDWKMPWFLITDPGGFVMSRQTLLGIKQRAEALARPRR